MPHPDRLLVITLNSLADTCNGDVIEIEDQPLLSIPWRMLVVLGLG